MHIAIFSILLLSFVLVGWLASKNTSSSSASYLLANRDISAGLTALSSVATKYSGYMFIGLIGYIYLHGLSAVWIMLGFLVGDMIAWKLAFAKVRRATSETGALNFSALLSQWHSKSPHQHYHKLRKLIAFITLIFLTLYAAAQLSAGGKVLQVILQWQPQVGTIIGAVIILSYCLLGGLRASIWTDALQAILMISSLILICGVICQHLGGVANFWSELSNISPNYLDLGITRFGSLNALMLFAIGWLFNGIGTLGQPHIIVRLMALNPRACIQRSACYYFFWSTIFLSLILLVGLSTRLFIDPDANFDAELALPILAHTLLPSLAMSFVVAGIFSSIISTADSQILSCSAVLSEDFSLRQSPQLRSFTTLVICLFALVIALSANTSVFSLVIFAWSALASSFGSLVILMALGKRPSEPIALLMVFSGLCTSITWRLLELNVYVYEGLPGLIIPLIVFGFARLFHKNSFYLLNPSK